MNIHKASLYHSLILIFFGGWGYFETNAKTALIPIFIGILLLLLNKGLKNQNKVSSHLAVLLTFLILGGLFKPLMGAIEDLDKMGIFRICIMLASTIFAFYYQIQSFLNARRKNK